MGRQAAKDEPIQNDRPLLRHRAEEVRKQIRASQLVARLQDIADGTVKGEPALLGVQTRAAMGLLSLCVPTLSSIEQDVKVEATVNIIVEQIK
jgi:hypothetical protein